MIGFLWSLYSHSIFLCCGEKQEVGDDLSVCVMNILPKVISLQSLLAINLMLVTWSKGHVWEHLTLCQHLAYCGVDTSACAFMGENSSHHVTTLKSLMTIDILIVKRKNASSETSYRYVLTMKNWVEWITTRRKKNGTNTKMVHFEKMCPEIKKYIYFSPYDYLL